MGAKAIKKKKKCATCCAEDEKKNLEAELQVPKGTTFDGQNKAVIAYSEQQMKLNNCIEYTDIRVVEQGGYGRTVGGWSQTQMSKDIWNSGVLGSSPVPSWTVTPGSVKMQTLKGW